MKPKPRSDKGHTRKVLPEQLQEAIRRGIEADDKPLGGIRDWGLGIRD